MRTAPPADQRTPPPVLPGATPWLFPDPREAGDDGLVGFGADLEPATLVHAYRHGLFPWPHDGTPLPWFSPDPRAVLPLDRWRASTSLRKRMRRCGWETTVDAAFEDVLRACADRGPDQGTWLTPEMHAAYTRLHRLGWAHSLEVWDGETLVGGIYGVLVGGVFTGESMFHRATDASKVAVFALVDRLREGGASLLDVQLQTEHLASLGAVEVARALFLELLAELRDDDVRLSTERRPVARLATVPRC